MNNLGKYFLIIMLSVMPALALDYTVASYDNSIIVGEDAMYVVTFVNDVNFTVDVDLYATNRGWDVRPETLADWALESITPGDERLVTIIATPDETVDPGVYYLSLQADDHVELTSVPLKVYVKVDGNPEYAPSVLVEVDYLEEVAPLEVNTVTLNLDNRNPLDLSDLQVHLESDLPGLDTYYDVPLGPLEDKQVVFTYSVPQYQEPGSYSVYAVFKRGGITFAVEEFIVRVTSSDPVLVQDLNVSSTLLSSMHTLSVSNPGNDDIVTDLAIPVTFWQRFFSQSDGVLLNSDTGYAYVWTVELAPGASADYAVYIRYTPLVYVAVILLLFATFVWYVRVPVRVRKGALSITGNDGALQELKIAVEVTNLSGKPVADVVVTEMVPGIANLHQHFDPGTLEPTRILKLPTGSKVQWDIATLEPYEHRIITYTLRTGLNVLGTFKLPRATSEFRHKGKIVKSYSNVFRLDANIIDE